MGFTDSIQPTNRVEKAAANTLENKIPLLRPLLMFHAGQGVNRLLTYDQITGRGFNEAEVTALVEKGYLNHVRDLERMDIEEKNNVWYTATDQLLAALQTGVAKGA